VLPLLLFLPFVTDYFGEAVGFKARAPYETAVHIIARQKNVDVLGRHATSVEDTDAISRIPVYCPQDIPDKCMYFLRLLG